MEKKKKKILMNFYCILFDYMYVHSVAVVVVYCYICYNE